MRQDLFKERIEIIAVFGNMRIDEKFKFIMIGHDYDINTIFIKGIGV